jgi:hypothetical protein
MRGCCDYIPGNSVPATRLNLRYPDHSQPADPECGELMIYGSLIGEVLTEKTVVTLKQHPIFKRSTANNIYFERIIMS